MKPAPFTYVRAGSVAHALQHVGTTEDAKYLAGGQSLLAVMNYRLARPEVLVDIGGLAELGRVFDDDGSLLLGGLCTHRFVETDWLVAEHVPMLKEAARHVGHLAIRNRGTLGGTLAHADPAAEIPATLIALGASVFVERHGQPRRELAVSDLYEGFYTTVLDRADLITWVRVPKLSGRSGWGFSEVARRHGDFAEAGCAAVAWVREDNTLAALRLALFGLGDRPLLVEPDVTDVTLHDLGGVDKSVADTLEPLDQPVYRRRLARHCIRTSVADAIRRASDIPVRPEPTEPTGWPAIASGPR